MDFHWALEQMKQGKHVRRKVWNVTWSKLQQNMWIQFPEKKSYGKPILRMLFGSVGLLAEDLLATDWEEHQP